MELCPFCAAGEAAAENALAFALFDDHPVSRGHMLILVRRHIADLSEATGAELLACLSLLRVCRGMLDHAFAPDGYNIGLNCGAAAGQTIPHLHIHLIPRYAGDLSLPRGGGRGLVRVHGCVGGLSEAAAEGASVPLPAAVGLEL